MDFEGYKVVPLRVRKQSKYHHQIFMKEHYIRVSDPDKPKGRTLFLLNIPPYVEAKHLSEFFSKFGEVSVLFSQKPGKDEDGCSRFKNVDKLSTEKQPFTFKVGYVVFESAKFLRAALEITTLDLTANKTNIVKTGIEKWMDEFTASVIPEEELQSEVNEFMTKFDVSEKSKVEAEKSKEDDDGWITVGKRGKNAGFEQKQSILNKLEEKMEKNQKNKELKNFYTFQIRESKMKNIVSLRKKFEEDKKKIELMKKSRRFKPF